jgi:hypothetical protein
MLNMLIISRSYPKLGNQHVEQPGQFLSFGPTWPDRPGNWSPSVAPVVESGMEAIGWR